MQSWFRPQQSGPKLETQFATSRSGKTEFQKKVKDHVDIQPNASASAKLDNYLHPDKQSSREKLSTFTEPNVVPTYVPLKDALAVLDIVPQSFGDEAREYVYSSSPIGGKENVESALFNKIPKTLFFYLGKDMEKDHMREYLPMTRRHCAHNKWLKNSASSMPLFMAIYSKSIGIV
ncbi:hypothetical protein QC760_008245 [Botrytis cinerea]